MRPQTTFVSATPGPWEMERTGGVFTEQVIRPTGLIDPPVDHPARPRSQVDDLIAEAPDCAKKGQRVLVTTLTKRMAEDLTEYMHEAGMRVRYMHSDVETLERIEIIRDLRLGAFDVLVGINLLREGLDIPECALVAILDADKEGFLRSQTSLVQTIGRAARNIDGRVILYADTMTERSSTPSRDQPAAREAAGLQRGERHHAGIGARRASTKSCSLRARPLDGRYRRVGRRPPDRPQSEQSHRRAGEADARRRRQSGIRGGRARPRRDPPPRGQRTRAARPGCQRQCRRASRQDAAPASSAACARAGGRGKQARRSGR